MEFIILDIVDIDLILGMDCLVPYHVVLNCFTKTMTLSTHIILRLE